MSKQRTLTKKSYFITEGVYDFICLINLLYSILNFKKINLIIVNMLYSHDE